MKILLVDDHQVVRQGLKQMLADEYPKAAFGEAGTAAEAVQAIHRQKWDLVLLDLNLPGRGGLDALGDFKAAQPLLPVLVLSMHPEAEFAVQALRAGAAGYLTKQSAAEELLAAVQKALEGGRYITASLAEKLAADVAGDNRQLPHEELSPREFETLRRLAAGHSVKEISSSLGLSSKTVSTYRARVLEKLKLRTTVDLARYAMEHGLVG
jgi:two-component system, NarL family, invasion response regulator UvrY